MSNETRKVETRSKLAIKKVDGKLRIYVGVNQKPGSRTVELVQKVTTKSYYKSKQYNDNLQDSLVAEEEFDAPEKEFSSTQIRVAWIQVPSKYSDQDIVNMVNGLPEDACIARTLSYHPILTEGQAKAIASPELDFNLDQVAESQVVRDKQGNIALHNGFIQYKKNLFFKTAKADMDKRDAENVYQPDFLMEEINGAVVYDDMQNV